MSYLRLFEAIEKEGGILTAGTVNNEINIINVNTNVFNAIVKAVYEYALNILIKPVNQTELILIHYDN